MSDQQEIPEDEALAAEYVLRLLDVDAEQAFEARLKNEPELRELVQFWEAEFAALAVDVPEEVPSPSIRSKLLAELSGGQASAKRSWTWGWLAFPGLAAVAVAAFLVFSPMLSGPAFDPTLHATLISEDGAVHIEAGYSPDGNLFKVIPEQGEPATGRAFELWVIGAEAQAPVSLGVIPADRESLFEITPEIAALIDGGTLAVSDEPEGGSPTGAPTGAILAVDEFFDADLFRSG
ncbi:Anti-sigma-K factor rskA [Roseovarius tolerans]|uniref:Anti-sigma-K factor rskA n=1 Tax=Roseovarius tolerans TaxID=74031 RepID=A0A0L6CUJ4_9RHOB|nr:anti-sigma factor [Roseovarius tolerans]KNX41396.1 Anti-sigma-K factor rskA [Roseovarius tolerans]